MFAISAVVISFDVHIDKKREEDRESEKREKESGEMGVLRNREDFCGDNKYSFIYMTFLTPFSLLISLNF